MITTRFYFSQKYTRLLLQNKKGGSLRYHPNTTLNMGVGATYQSVSLNLAYGFGFLNQDKEKGHTSYLDLQSHLYSRQWVVDFFGQFYNGYFLYPKGTAMAHPHLYYTRRDIEARLLGLSVYRVLNGDKFSFRAAMIQNEWQKKSAGSFLLGAELYYGTFSGDSAIVPAVLANEHNQWDVNKVMIAHLGPGAGYAYTFVWRRHYFATAGLTVNVHIGLNQEHSPAKTTNLSFIPDYQYRFALGYNSEKWTMNVSGVSNNLVTTGAAAADKYFINTANFRVTYARRFAPGPRLQRKLHWLDALLGKE